MIVDEIDKNVPLFCAQARNKVGDNYIRATLLSLRNVIERCLKTTPNNLCLVLGCVRTLVLSFLTKRDGLQNTIPATQISGITA